jgi:hypothetical protein
MKKNIVFMGTPEFSVETLRVLKKSQFDLKCVYTQPPKKSSRGQKINPSPVQTVSEKLGIKVRSPNTLNNNEEYEYLKSCGTCRKYRRRRLLSSRDTEPIKRNTSPTVKGSFSTLTSNIRS